MHVLHLTTWHPIIDDVSGIFILEQCAAIQALGIQVGLIFARVEGLRTLSLGRLARGWPGFERIDNPVPTLGFKTWNAPLMPVPWREAMCRALLKNRFGAYMAERGKPDVLHAHAGLETGSVTRSIGQLAGLPYVVTEHSSEVLNGISDERRHSIAADVYRDAHRVLAVSDCLASRIADICPEARIVVVPNLVRDFVFRMRREEPFDHGRLRVVSIGGLVAGKRTQDAIEALSALPASMRARVEHHIVGDGPDRRALERAASAGGVRTHFHGRQPHSRAMELLAQADLFLHASAFETFGVVIAEAMALGVPTIATRAGGSDRLVTEATGRMVDVGDVRAMTRGIADILCAIDEWSTKRESISRVAFERFHETVVAKAIVEAYT